ncbi:unnamed protein product [Adineta ricciae]|uniref:F-box domain-containing protein n=1 Tax=Adineta ricciae TaxID=249248 RepID=A0A814M263_ADIRI|nr:unnamed protein product [Adineta ricciae]
MADKAGQFENLSDELLLEIFQYLHALDLFTAFSSLNNHFTSILSSVKLHVVINDLHSHHHVQFLSSFLHQHAHQVISISLHDQLHNMSSVIHFLFNQHSFENLRHCTFSSISSTTELITLVDQLKLCTKLISFKIFQPFDLPLSSDIKKQLISIALQHVPPKFQSVDLSFWCYAAHFLVNNSINSTLTRLHVLLTGSIAVCSIYSVLYILRMYYALRVFYIDIKDDEHASDQQLIPRLLTSFVTHPPIVLSLTSFYLHIISFCDLESLRVVLRCMPNLRQLVLTIVPTPSILPRYADIFKGDEWEKLLTSLFSQLNLFDLLVSVEYPTLPLDPAVIVNSFDCFTKKYDDWQLLSRDTNKLIERFPSLVHLEFQLSFGKELPPLLDIFLGGLPDLVHIRVHFDLIRLVQNEKHCIDYIAKKRRTAFPWIACNAEDISVRIVRKTVNIYLKGCSMCTNNANHC